MTIASEIQNYANGLGDAYDAVNDMGGIIPQDKNMNNLDTAIRTIPQNQGASFVTFHWGGSPTASMYADSGFTTPVTASDIKTAFEDGGAIISDHTEYVEYTVTSCDSTFCEAVGRRTVPSAAIVEQHFSYMSATWTKTTTEIQEKLIAGTNISIAADGKTISATGGAAATFFYFDETTHDLYKESTYTTVATITDVLTAYNDGPVIIKDGELDTDLGTDGLTVTAASFKSVFCLLTTANGTTTWDVNYEYDSAQTPKWVRWERALQRELTAGSNISISGTTISATDTTYSNFTGATSLQAGTAGLVPAPTTSDPGKFLKGDGTWGAINDCTTFYVDGSVTANGIYSLAMDGYRQYTLYKDDALTVAATALEFWDAFEKGSVRICALLDFNGYYDDYIVTARMCNDSETDEAYYQIGSPYGWDAGGIRFMISISTTSNTVYFTKRQYVQVMHGASSSSDGAVGVVPAPSAGDQNKALKGDGTWGDVSEEFVIMKYGEAGAWAKFLDAYKKNKIVYCRASSNANPATGAQTRLAFMAYVSDEANPTNVEFQYVRSVGTKTSTQPVDQVFVYKLTNASGGTWSVQTRDMAPKVEAGAGINVSYSNGTYTISVA